MPASRVFVESGHAAARVIQSNLLKLGLTGAIVQKRDALAWPFDGDRFGVELPGGMAVLLGALFQLLADEPAVVRLILVDAAQDLPGLAIPWKIIQEDDERFRVLLSNPDCPPREQGGFPGASLTG